MPKPASSVWVTGARGFLGRHVARKFSGSGCVVTGIGRGEWSDHADWGVSTWFDAPVLEESLHDLMRRADPPQVVFHSAGSGSVNGSFIQPRRSFDDTVGSTLELIEFLRASAPECVVVYPSSCAVYGEASEQPLEESARIDPISVYGTHKAMTEALLRAAATNFGIACGIVRYFSVYGPGLRKQLMWDVARRAAEGEEPVMLGGTGSETRDLLHIDDAVELAAVVADGCLGSEPSVVTVNGGSGRETAVAEIARLVLENLRPGTGVEFSGERRAGDPQRYVASTKRAEALGFSPTWSVEEGIADYCGWLLTAVAA